MQRKLAEILVCPICKGPLKLEVTEENETEVVSGSLYCGSCHHSYPIVDTIPNLLPPEPAVSGSQGE